MKDLPETIALSIKQVGIQETASTLCRALIFLCHLTGHKIEFESELGSVKINGKQSKSVH